MPKGEVNEWTLGLYMEPRSFRPSLDIKTFMNFVYPWAAYAQTYYLHAQDRRVFFEKGEYRFYDAVPKGMEKVDAFRRWIHEELIGGKRPFGKNSIPTNFVPAENIVRS